jgi:SPP1 family holin
MDISKGTIIRVAVLLLGLINMALTSAGYGVLPIDEVWLETVITDVWVIVAAIVAAWKNNSFTKAAIEADKIMRAIKIFAKQGTECVAEFSNGKGDENE